MANPPVNIAKFAIGDGTVASGAVFEFMPTVSAFVHQPAAPANKQQLSILETFPQLIGYDPAVYNYFKEQCVASSEF